MSDPVAGEEVVEEVWTPKAAAAAAEAVSLNQQQQQPKSFKFAALAGGISLSGVKCDDNMQPFAPALPLSLPLFDASDAGTSQSPRTVRTHQLIGDRCCFGCNCFFFLP